MCAVRTVSFELLFAFIVIGHCRRQLLWFEVTRHPTAAWLARQITEAFPWASAPTYLLRDNDRAYGHVFTSRVKASRVSGSNADLWRGAPAANPFRLCGLLQSRAHASGTTERRAPTPRRPAIWIHCQRPNIGRITSPICSDMIFGKDRSNYVPTTQSGRTGL